MNELFDCTVKRVKCNDVSLFLQRDMTVKKYMKYVGS